ncbi:hypothetical protein HX866_27060 [Pseudomonas gingeri]|uniref:hypothetical protein n=1 Tax=Pseudomonas gingeri TaxID=117681 RepID=UPI00159F966A|nr:hypothetical protein [Pseudomonas gingeri]NWA28554.1 hypothetical protein [Pseudomonas gingeri]
MDDFQRALTITIINASGTDLLVNYGVLTGGNWSTAPAPGSEITPAGQQSYVNGTSNTFSALGGQILLTPASGGTINPTWSLPVGGPVSSSVNATSLTGLAVTSQLINTQTNFPTLQVMITNASTFG